MSTPERELTFAEAVREALAEEMRRDPNVFIMGEDVAEAGTPFKVLSGLVEEFGRERVMDTPISEPGFTGLGVGAAITGFGITGSAGATAGTGCAATGDAAVPRVTTIWGSRVLRQT